MRVVICLIIILLLPKGGFAQTLPLTKISTNNGLPSSIVYSVFQDSKFRYWVCTDNGVSLYDGCLLYTSDAADE